MKKLLNEKLGIEDIKSLKLKSNHNDREYKH